MKLKDIGIPEGCTHLEYRRPLKGELIFNESNWLYTRCDYSNYFIVAVKDSVLVNLNLTKVEAKLLYMLVNASAEDQEKAILKGVSSNEAEAKMIVENNGFNLFSKVSELINSKGELV